MQLNSSGSCDNIGPANELSDYENNYRMTRVTNDHSISSGAAFIAATKMAKLDGECESSRYLL